jgi:predicted anti-sigma-YlaC factor YlaD
MSECERMEQLIERWLDGELSSVESERVRAHVSDCERCRAARLRFERIGDALNRVLVVGAPRLEFAPFWRGIEGRIQQTIPWHQELFDRARGWVAAPKAAWAIPALIAALIAIFSYESYLPFGKSRNNLATVESIDSYGRSVALLREDESKTTVIWLYQNPEGDDEAAEETPQPGPAF